MTNAGGYVESFNGRMGDELLNESLFFGLDNARTAIAEWADDYNNVRPHSSLEYQTPAAYAGTIAATGSNATQYGSFAFPPVAHIAPSGVSKNRQGSNRSRMKVQWQVKSTGSFAQSVVQATFARSGQP